MTTKQVLITIIVLLVLLVLALGLLLLVGNKAPASSTTTATSTAVTISPILGATSTEGGDYHYVENKSYYTVDITYPAQLSLATDASIKAERVIEQALADDIAQFKQDGDFANLTPADIQTQGLGGDRKYAFGATYEKYEGTNTVSYVFLVYEDTLGAHPNSFYSTFTFDQNGNLLQLADLFKPSSNYLNVLSPLAYQGVVSQLKAKEGSAPGSDELDTARMGTAPTADALQFYYIDSNTLHLLFPPYQVASYAAGAFDVPIPMSELNNILQ
jgi:hypothetical protein